jgi:glutaminyl-tRNA synthetase
LSATNKGDRFQFLRLGYFVTDQDSTNVLQDLSCAEKPVFNRIVTLKDTWAKLEKKA